ncbi:MAG: hypothetical protein AUK33_04355 [Flavobacteriaceae bacterium CG2_30_34_30]|nr:PspC domain-containing protein [Flavobacteriia bacterium]OIP51401.1 MAG: hypothetical protein AUK33_04355 [Flavobacteriaceae bacterium CG2_30_34_30]PIQ18008.1 MAG: hypothetical protein COW66_08725 [Flavobacteriaceae bacterium CG18_big_fil_WC_8_21_14_2_50_34_36]PIV51507.1 MAG: hypothetical protein COS19_01005 [Flavobacteriaceae bacterium CG02_land_8_20_14_3_00_34_13]PIZ07357.1 MAG: hypothetical protein COY56_09470 [Flavobacteriaceae bacterium CG_4_10_14_0_8_um_filter_34_31]PJC06116.1 MAG: hy
MNKTVNINLAGTFFHIDEDAFGKLNRYLNAIKNSFTNPQGQDEIIRDIEARIAELFSEKLDNNKQVITMKELDEVISIMGQPEDYAVDEELFDDTPEGEKQQNPKGYKKLFRDIDNKYIGGVSSGLGHYLGMDAIWVRLLWILLTIFTSGTFILIYIIFWILVPEAKTVAEKLTMTGEPVNISNIERKIKENYDEITDRIKNADYDKYGKRIKSGSENFFDTLGKIIMALLTVFVKFLGVILILISALTLIGLFIGLFITGISGIFGTWYTDFFNIVNDTVIPIWLVSIMFFFAIGIPFFFLFILGLKILVNNLKSIGKITKLSLLGIWILSILGLILFGIFQASEQAYEGNVIKSEKLEIKAQDTIYLSMVSNEIFDREMKRGFNLSVKLDENDKEVLYSNGIRLIVKSTKDSIATITTNKKAKGSNYLTAKNRANAIDYNYVLEGNTLKLDAYFLTEIEEKYRGQEIEITLYLPIGTILNADSNTQSFHRNSNWYQDILENGDEEYFLEIQDGKTLCLNCPEGIKKQEEENDDNFRVDWEDENWQDTWKDGNKIKIDKEGIDIQILDEVDSVNVKLNRKGINVKTN